MLTRVPSPTMPLTKIVSGPGSFACAAKSAVVVTSTTSPPSPPVVPFVSRSGTDAQPIGAESNTGGPGSTAGVEPSLPVGTDVGALAQPIEASPSASARPSTANQVLPTLAL